MGCATTTDRFVSTVFVGAGGTYASSSQLTLLLNGQPMLYHSTQLTLRPPKAGGLHGAHMTAQVLTEQNEHSTKQKNPKPYGLRLFD